MKVFVTSCLLFVALGGAAFALPVSEPEPEWMIIPDMQNRLHRINLNEPEPQVKVDESNITFYYFSRNTRSFELKLSTILNIFNTDFSADRKTMVIIHGWTSNGKSEMNDLVTDALLDMDDWNIFNVDWHEPASQNYILSKAAIPGVARIVADFITYLNDHLGLSYDNLYITGHSLGGQMSGRVGAYLNGQAAYIMGLDPALPMFNYNNLVDRLDPSDAKHVQVIHTNGGMLGYMLPLGHSDFYPNGGMSQKGCGADTFGMCSHVRAYLYFAESIRYNNFLSHHCDDYGRYVDGHCHDNHFAHMGGNKLDESAVGSYYLETSDSKPFGLA